MSSEPFIAYLTLIKDEIKLMKIKIKSLKSEQTHNKNNNMIDVEPDIKQKLTN